MDKRKGSDDYIQISEHHFLKKDNFDYFTEKDLIKRICKKDGSKYEEVEDVYIRLMEHIKNKVEKPNNNYEAGFSIPLFGYFRKRSLNVDDLLMDRESISFKRAKVLLDDYCSRNTSIINVK